MMLNQQRADFNKWLRGATDISSKTAINPSNAKMILILRNWSATFLLNPLRAGLVDTLGKLNRYRWCGHSALLGTRKNSWQDQVYVLKWFGSRQGPARKVYLEFVKKGVAQGRRPELVGGGLIRSLGGWSVVKSLRKSGIFEKGDERILGSGDFVESVYNQAEEKIKYQLPAKELETKAAALIGRKCKDWKIEPKVLRSGSHFGEVSRLGAILTIQLVNELGLSLAESARHLGVTTSAFAKILRRQNLINYE